MLARGDADMVSMARPFLADADFVNKAAAGRADEINTCIACNQACLDHIFERKLRVLPGQSRTPAARPSVRSQPTGARRTRRRRRRRPGRPGRGDHRGRARPRGHAVRGGARDRRPVQPRASAFPARRSSTRRCATSARASTGLGVEVQARPRALPGRPARASITSSSPPASCRARRRSPASSTPRW